MKTPQTHTGINITFFPIPAFTDQEEAAEFDRQVLKHNPHIIVFIRHVSPVEFPPGEFEEKCPPEYQMFATVHRSAGQGLLKQFEEELEREVVINRLIEGAQQ